ncbi:hypothetical protein LPU83_pLPU83d_1415 (plasmid) [Rhizobium favelukesii]|uniref:Uncharacterized protein n=1 Tax=Rhizobium favelukesii TaxID=348824 RepID=W6RRK9_9HYPH|nr:hypothetical protein LPU83_pLPU83d_1415 [Rhizobium favelukesii]
MIEQTNPAPRCNPEQKQADQRDRSPDPFRALSGLDCDWHGINVTHGSAGD